MKPTTSETRAPWMRRLSTSRPSVSVPSGCASAPPRAHAGGLEAIEQVALEGVGGGEHGRQGRHQDCGGDHAQAQHRRSIAPPSRRRAGPQESLMRGSTAAYRRSTARFSGDEDEREDEDASLDHRESPGAGTACTMRRPSPGHEKTVSMTMAPLSMKPRLRPLSVTKGMAALRRAWR